MHSNRQEMNQLLQEAKVPSKMILDSAIGYVMYNECKECV